MTIHALNNNLLLASVPVFYRDRPKGSFSKLNTISDGIKVILMILNLLRTYRPLLLFGGLFVIMAVTSIALFIPILLTYLSTGLVPRFPTLIVSGLLMVAAFLSMTCGIILDTIATNNRKNFEMLLNLITLQISKVNEK